MLPRRAFFLLALASAPFSAACGLHQAADGDLCGSPQVVAGVAEATGSSSGSVELRGAGGTSSVSFATPPAGATVPTQSSPAIMQGKVHDDGSGGTTLIVNVASSFHPYAEFTLPDLRPLEKGAVAPVPVQGSVEVPGGGCNFSAVATLTVTRAEGSGAPSPAFVTDDFVRSASLVLESATLEAVVGGAGKGAPDCSGTLAARATIELTAASFAPVYDDGSCVDLSK